MIEIKRFESIYRERFIKAKVISIIQNFAFQINKPLNLGEDGLNKLQKLNAKLSSA